jgi:hypothetical protein
VCDVPYFDGAKHLSRIFSCTSVPDFGRCVAYIEAHFPFRRINVSFSITLMHAVRLIKNRYHLKENYCDMTKANRPVRVTLDYSSCAYWRDSKYCPRLRFPRSWFIIKHEYFAVTHTVSGRFRY